MRDIQPLIQYVQQKRNAGVPDEETKSVLLQEGAWSEEEVAAALSHDAKESISDLAQSNAKPNFKKVTFITLVILLVVVGGAYAAYNFGQPKSPNTLSSTMVAGGGEAEDRLCSSLYEFVRSENVWMDEEEIGFLDEAIDGSLKKSNFIEENITRSELCAYWLTYYIVMEGSGPTLSFDETQRSIPTVEESDLVKYLGEERAKVVFSAMRPG